MPDAARAEQDEISEPRTSRKHFGGGGSSTRSFLFTILGEFVMPDGGSVWTSALVGALEKLGFEERASRQALARTASDGWLHSERIGRKTCWRVTPSGERILTEGRERLFNFCGVQNDWDGTWLVVLVRVPDASRAAGQKLRTRLRWTGLGNPTPGVWVTTHVDRLAEVEGIITRAGLRRESQIFTSRYAGGGEPADMVRLAWDLDFMKKNYKEFLSDFQVDYTSEPLVRLLRLSHAWRRLPMIDPGLPPELLPAEWDGIEASDRFRKLHSSWLSDAREQWRSLT